MSFRAVLSGVTVALLCGPALAQDVPDVDWPPPPSLDGLLQGGPGTGRDLSLAPGALVIHGNYCGVGDNGPGLPPIDALDAACMRHDACTPQGRLPSCGCNARLGSDAHWIARSSRTDPELRILAGMVESAVPLIPCHP